jgi:acyl-coenzyme A thioesterase PaaI-like protein
MASVEFKVNFLAPAFVDAGQLTAVAKLIKRGRRVAVCQSEVWQQQVQVAIGLFTYAMWPESG